MKITFSKIDVKINDATIKHITGKAYVLADGFNQPHLRHDIRTITYRVVSLITKWTSAMKRMDAQVYLVNSWTYQTDCN